MKKTVEKKSVDKTEKKSKDKVEKKINVDDDYFKKLMVYMDFTQSQSYCENVSSKMLIFLSDSRYITINGFVSTNKNDFKIYSKCSQKDSRNLALYLTRIKI